MKERLLKLLQLSRKLAQLSFSEKYGFADFIESNPDANTAMDQLVAESDLYQKLEGMILEILPLVAIESPVKKRFFHIVYRIFSHGMDIHGMAEFETDNPYPICDVIVKKISEKLGCDPEKVVITNMTEMTPLEYKWWIKEKEPTDEN